MRVEATRRNENNFAPGVWLILLVGMTSKHLQDATMAPKQHSGHHSLNLERNSECVLPGR